MTRIIGGEGKRRRLKSPRGLSTRPTGSRVKQTLFDILAGELPGARFLDLFAGGGGVGLEALSRGAAYVVLVDRDSQAVAAIRENLRRLAGAGGEARVFQQEAVVAISALTDSGERFDLVFLDPPYESALYEAALLGVGGLLNPGGAAVAQHFHKRPLPETIGVLVRRRLVRVGDHCLSFYRRREGLQS